MSYPTNTYGPILMPFDVAEALLEEALLDERRNYVKRFNEECAALFLPDPVQQKELDDADAEAAALAREWEEHCL